MSFHPPVELRFRGFHRKLKYYGSPTSWLGFSLNEEVKVTRKYQVTIPEDVREKLGVRIGDKLVVKSEDNRIIMESPRHVSNPSDKLWNLFGKPLDIDATKLVEESWKETHPIEPGNRRLKRRKALTH